MTIANNYVPLKQLGNGVTVNFSGLWPVFNASYIRVYLENVTTGIQTLQTLGSDYTLAFTDAGFTVTFLVAPTSANYVVVGRSITVDQIVPYKTLQGFQGEIEEASYDKLTGISQEIRDLFTRTLTFPLGDTAGITLPTATLRANKTLIFDALGAPTVGSVTGTTVSAAMIPVVGAATLATALALLGALSTAAGAVGNTNLATMVANTVKANATAGAASPTDIAIALNQLFGRGAAGNISAITLGTGLSFSGTTLNATAGGAQVVSQVFTGSGTYTPTAGMKYCIVEMVGGGGGGGGASTPGSAGGGGGAGYAKKVISAAAIGASKAVTIGAGGAAGSTGGGDGGAGGTTSLAALMSASGGTGGIGTTGGYIRDGGAAGTGTSGDFNSSGQPGHPTGGVATGPSGAGGASPLGGGGQALKGNSDSSGGNGSVGGGGSGGFYATGGGKAGGTGGNGIVIITEFL